MREETQIVKTQKTVYIALDGKAFDTAEECLEYEKVLAKNDELETKRKALEINFWEFPTTILTNFDVRGESEVKWYAVKDQDDLDIITEAYKRCDQKDIERYGPYTGSLEPIEFPTKVCVYDVYPEYSDFVVFYTLDDVISDAKSRLKSFELEKEAGFPKK